MILCCGEALIDMLPRKTSEGEAAFAPHAGGAVMNTAVALGRLGSPVQFFSGMSDDLFGDVLREHLAASKVDTGPVHTSSKPTTLAFVKLVDGHASYAFYDENTAGRMLSTDNLPDVTAETLFFGGISLVVEPCGATYEALMLREAPTKLTMIDPNIRPSFITDEARYRARLTAMLGQADIIKTSDEDLAWINGNEDVAPLFEGTKTSCVLLTRGSEGVTIHTRAGSTDVPADKATVVDTVGAGDTFNAGFLAGLGKSGHLTKSAFADVTMEALRDAAALGAKTAARALLQRVTDAAVRVDDKVIGEIGPGLLILVCAMQGDDPSKSAQLAAKISKLRVFQDEAGKMNKSLLDVGGSALIVSQFTLAADTSRGNRPGFSQAAPPAEGQALYEQFVHDINALGIPSATGQFGADMKVRLTNDGPVTIWLDV